MGTTQQSAFSIIATAGDAQEMMFKALSAAKTGNHAQAEKLMSEAETLLVKAHCLQTELLKQEATGEKFDFSILLVHAQNYVMNAILAKKLVSEMISLCKDIQK